jgi:hypothetical protein
MYTRDPWLVSDGIPVRGVSYELQVLFRVSAEPRLGHDRPELWPAGRETEAPLRQSTESTKDQNQVPVKGAGQTYVASSTETISVHVI